MRAGFVGTLGTGGGCGFTETRGRWGGWKCKAHHELRQVWTDRGPSLAIGTFTSSRLWRFVIASDGHAVQHLKTLSGREVSMKVIESREIDSMEDVPHRATLISRPLHRRQTFAVGSDGEVYMYIASWWNRDRYHDIVDSAEEDTPLWEIFNRKQISTARKITALNYGHNTELESVFGRSGPFWGKEYTYKQYKQPIAVFYEVFSPSISTFLGEMTKPTDLLTRNNNLTPLATIQVSEDTLTYPPR